MSSSPMQDVYIARIGENWVELINMSFRYSSPLKILVSKRWRNVEFVADAVIINYLPFEKLIYFIEQAEYSIKVANEIRLPGYFIAID